MRISIVAGTTTNPISYQLCNGTTELPQNFEFNNERMIEVATGLDWEYPLFFDRGNRRTEISFEVTKLWSSYDAAEGYSLMFDVNTPVRGLVKFEFGTGFRYVRWLEDAVIQTLRSRWMGVTSFFDFRVLGGKMMK